MAVQKGPGCLQNLIRACLLIRAYLVKTLSRFDGRGAGGVGSENDVDSGCV